DFQKNVSNAPDTYEAWAFGDSKEMADDLAALVAAGVKTATSSNYLLYEKNELLPYVGLHNIILDGDEQAVAIVENTAVEIVPFNEVTKEHAFLEGEGSRTLKYWRDAHEEFFKNEMTDQTRPFIMKYLLYASVLKWYIRINNSIGTKQEVNCSRQLVI